MKAHALVLTILACGFLCGGCRKQNTETAYPDAVVLRVDPGTVESGGTTTIIAAVQRGMTNRPGMKLKLQASGNCGKLSATEVTTGAGMSFGPAGPGEASITFKGYSPVSNCSELVTGTTEDNATGTAMITVTPKKITRTVSDAQVPPGESPPSIEVTPNVQQPVSNGFTATYTITVTGSELLSVRFQTTQKADFTANNPDTITPNAAKANSVTVTEPATGAYNSDVITMTSDSLKLGTASLWVTIKNPYGTTPIEVQIVDPTGQASVPGPG